MGPFLCIVSAAAFGAMAIFGKFAYAAGVTPETLVIVRFSLAALVLGTVVRIRTGSGTARPLAEATPLRVLVVAFVGLGAIGYATQASLFFAALEVMDASLLAIVFYTYPAMVTLAAALLGRERLTPLRVAALTMATIGVMLVVVGDGTLSFVGPGIAMALGTALTYTCYILVADRLTGRISPLPLAALVMSGAASSLLVRAALTGGIDLQFAAVGWLWLACIALVSTVLAMVTFFAGMAITGPSTAAILSTFEPLVTAALAAVVLHEAPTLVQLLGGVIILGAVVLLQLRAGRPFKAPRAGKSTESLHVPAAT